MHKPTLIRRLLDAHAQSRSRRLMLATQQRVPVGDRSVPKSIR